jgi:hypothetical protein
MIPGDIAFVKIPVTNRSSMQKAYRVVIDDPHAELFMEGRAEV